ncbi:hypothetical protein BcabD6B2_59080 (apicoplast) [Babesia caballi]|uniref:Ribosomal protein S2 n=1 Tax=Babesia caballi TaxID=5871 RepID=A0AAV4M326_BABCB|nr:hypothetical protein BcabD6B2_59080 [Babesia caballi]
MILTFNTLLKHYMHISNIRKLHKNTHNIYKIVNNSYIINLVYIASYLYKLYKILFLLSLKNMYITVINTTILPDYKFINYLTKFTNSNCFNKKWINGAITNNVVLSSIIVIHIFINKIFKLIKKFDNLYNSKFYSIKNKYNFAKYIKNLRFSKFIFILNLDSNITAVKECLIKNKFTMGACDLNFDSSLIDFNIYCNNVNPKSINFLLKFIITSSVQSKYLKNKKNNNKKQIKQKKIQKKNKYKKPNKKYYKKNKH